MPRLGRSLLLSRGLATSLHAVVHRQSQQNPTRVLRPAGRSNVRSQSSLSLSLCLLFIDGAKVRDTSENHRLRTDVLCLLTQATPCSASKLEDELAPTRSTHGMLSRAQSSPNRWTNALSSILAKLRPWPSEWPGLATVCLDIEASPACPAS